MAKPRTSKIKKINNRDRLAFEAIAKGGTISKEDLHSIISKTRANHWEHDRYFKQVSYNDNNNNRYEGYSLTHEGKKYAEKQFGITSCTKAKSSSVIHDLKIGEKVMSVDEDKRGLTRTEDELWDKLYEEMRHRKERIEELEEKRLDQSLSLQEREQYAKEWLETDKEYSRIEEMLKNGELSAPDISYINEQGVEVCYEVLTTNYGQEEINAKIEFARAIGMEIEFEQV